MGAGEAGETEYSTSMTTHRIAAQKRVHVLTPYEGKSEFIPASFASVLRSDGTIGGAPDTKGVLAQTIPVASVIAIKAGGGLAQAHRHLVKPYLVGNSYPALRDESYHPSWARSLG